MFVAQIILCSSIFGQCVGFEDKYRLNTDLVSCEKRAEALVRDASKSMPQFFAARTVCKKIPGLAT